MVVFYGYDVVMVWGYFINIKGVKVKKFLGEVNMNVM